MAYEVLARKWRPQRFEDVVGQEHVTQTLKNAIETGRIAHAYLFVGPRGVGKTSVARIFARALNCVKGPTPTPCGQCDSCKEIAAGNSLDVMEIDGASNNGVEQVRELRDTVKFAPVRGQYKIYIIDEVHMLSTAAFNALLKTLEEPPAHVKFIFATTEPQKVLATILSRCQRFDLRRIPVPLIVERLRQVAEAEKVQVDDDAFLAIARGAEGGLRDAESALDQLISFRGKTLREEDVLSVFGLVARSALEQLAEGVLQGDVQRLIEQVAHLDQAGKDLARLVAELMEHFRNLLVFMHVNKPADVMDLTEPQIETLKKQAKLTSSEKVLRLMGILAEAEDRMKFTLSRRTLLETALIRCARASVVVSLEEILARINALQAQGGGSAEDAPRAAGARQPPTAAPAGAPAHAKDDADTSQGKGAAPLAVAEPPAAYATRETRSPKGPADETMLLAKQWHDIVSRVAKVAIAAKSGLIDARPLAVDGERAVLGIDREFADEIESLENSRNRKAIEHVLSAVLKRAVRVEYRLVESGCAAGEASAEAEAKEPALAAPKSKPREPGKPKSAREWADDPAVRKALEVFGGSILEVRE